MKTRHILLMTLAVFFHAGCAEPHGESGDHPHPHASSGEHGHPHDNHNHPHEEANEAITRWGRKTQIFVKFPALVQGEESTFAVHLTDLNTHLPLQEGSVTVEISEGDALQTFSVQNPSSPGIFRPVITSPSTRKSSITIRLQTPTYTETHELGEFLVYPTRHKADESTTHKEADPTISYLLEQQWKVPFGVDKVESKPMRSNIPAFARLISPPGAAVSIVAPEDKHALAPNTNAFPVPSDRSKLWLDVGVPEAYVHRLKEISGVWFVVDGAQKTTELPQSALISVGDTVDPVTRTLPVRFLLDNTSGALFAGMMAQAHLVTNSPRPSMAVPLGAIVDDGGTDVVYVQTGGESFERRPVRVGTRDGDHVAVQGDLSPGDWVVSRGAYAVKLASTSTEAIGHGHAH